MVFSNAISEPCNLRYLDRIQTAVEQLNQSLGRAEARKQAFEPKTLDLDQFCRNLVAEIQAIATHLEQQDALKQESTAESQRISEPVTPQSILPSNSQLKEVFNFIEANYCQPITLCDVAEAVGYSPAYLTDLVRRQTGQTVNRWIVQRRMAEARFLLLKTNQSVESVAQDIGYLNTGHFFRQFRQYHGTTPQAWRVAQRNRISA